MHIKEQTVTLELPEIQTEQAEMELRDLKKELLVLRLAFGQLKAAIADAAAPLMAVLVPALTGAVRWATRLVRTIGQVISGVLGIQVAQSKVEKVVVSTGKALRRTVAGFDQLNRLQGNSGGGGVAVQTEAADTPAAISPKAQELVAQLNAMLEPLKNADFEPLRWQFYRLKDALSLLLADCGDLLGQLWNGVLAPFLVWAIEELAPVFLKTLTEGIGLTRATLLALGDGFSQLWGAVQPIAAFLGEVLLTVLQEVGLLFGRLRDAINDGTIAIRKCFYLMGVDLEYLWESAAPSLENMKLGFKTVFGFIGQVITDTCNGLLDAMRTAVQLVGTVVTNGWSALWDGMAQLSKGGINGILGFVNAMIKGFVDAVNGVVKILNKLKVTVPDWVPELGGKTFGFSLKTVKAPEVPYLAKGAVLPANQPFLAVVGDQKHGTNIEAPLATIQQAVALTMEDFAQGNLAGHQNTAAVLQQILRAVLGIRIGDTEIGQAAQRYSDKMALVRGSVY